MEQNKNKTAILLRLFSFSQDYSVLCDQLDLKQLKKELPELLKLIKGEDRILVIGTTENPQSADTESLCKMYTKIILIPRPDYGSRYSMTHTNYPL